MSKSGADRAIPPPTVKKTAATVPSMISCSRRRRDGARRSRSPEFAAGGTDRCSAARSESPARSEGPSNAKFSPPTSPSRSTFCPSVHPPLRFFARSGIPTYPTDELDARCPRRPPRAVRLVPPLVVAVEASLLAGLTARLAPTMTLALERAGRLSAPRLFLHRHTCLLCVSYPQSGPHWRRSCVDKAFSRLTFPPIPRVSTSAIRASTCTPTHCFACLMSRNSKRSRALLGASGCLWSDRNFLEQSCSSPGVSGRRRARGFDQVGFLRTTEAEGDTDAQASSASTMPLTGAIRPVPSTPLTKVRRPTLMNLRTADERPPVHGGCGPPLLIFR